MKMHMEEELAGKTIVGLRVKSPSVWFEVKGGGWIEITVEGDCCSSAFVDATCWYGAEVTLSGATLEMNFPAAPTEQEVDQLTAVRFLGEGGYISILHRNSSNGYYANYLAFNSRGNPPMDAEDGKSWFRRPE